MAPNLNFTAATSTIALALLDHFITSVNSFHPALKYTWEISETSISFLDIKVSINGNGLSTSEHRSKLMQLRVDAKFTPKLMPEVSEYSLGRTHLYETDPRA